MLIQSCGQARPTISWDIKPWNNKQENISELAKHRSWSRLKRRAKQMWSSSDWQRCCGGRWGGGRKTYVLSKQERPCLTSLHVRNSFYHSKERIILRFWEERMCDFLIKKMKYKLGTQLMWRLHNVLRNKMRGFNEKQLSKRCQSWMLLLGPMSNHEDVKQDWKLHLIVKVRMFNTLIFEK